LIKKSLKYYKNLFQSISCNLTQFQSIEIEFHSGLAYQIVAGNSILSRIIFTFYFQNRFQLINLFQISTLQIPLKYYNFFYFLSIPLLFSETDIVELADIVGLHQEIF
jgi:hypothetical protein